MALLLTVATGAWAQDPDPIDLTPSADGTVWTLSMTRDWYLSYPSGGDRPVLPCAIPLETLTEKNPARC